MKEKIYTFIQSHPGSASSDMSNFFGISRIAIYKHLQKLLQEKRIRKTGTTKLSRYFPIELDTIKNFSFLSNIHSAIIEQYHGLEDINIEKILQEIISYLTADGQWKYGIYALYEIIKNENHRNEPTEELLEKRTLDFLYRFFDEEAKRRKNRFFDGTQSMQHILGKYDMPLFVDVMMFTQIFAISGFGRLRVGNEIYWGKKNQNEILLRAGIEKGLDMIVKYISQKKITHVVYTPATLKRTIQFRNVLKRSLAEKNIVLQAISCKKKYSTERTLKPQKDTKGYDRIINARSSMILENINSFLNVPEIIIFDDNFTTGATINAIAEMMRTQGYTNKITAITLTGGFQYIPGITDIGEI